ncbi:imidazole glycerol phosphate synthase subunit HisF [Desulfocurvus sp. DL9XJH121]
MPKPRVIAKLLIREDICVQSVDFSRYFPLGRPEISIRHFNSWGADEIVCLHRGGLGDDSAFERVKRYASCCQVPLAVGGGLDSLEAVRKVLYYGADKAVLNTALVTVPDTVTAAAKSFGSQSVVASIDVRGQEGQWRAWINGGATPTGLDPAELARRAQDLGAGEILLASIDRDGQGQGLDVDLLLHVAGAVSVPVILAGGAGRPEHFQQAFLGGADAVAAGNMLHYAEHSVTLIKRFLVDYDVHVRLDTPFDYRGISIDNKGRLLKRSAEEIESLFFVKMKPLVI